MVEKSSEIVAQSKRILDILEQLKTVALSDCTVLLIGETGVGKELFADYLHHYSARRFKPIVKVGAATLPFELVESELFGHEKGAFTGAHMEKKGLFEAANGGTLFLDDIDDLPIGVQAKLLRALERHEIQRVGSTVCLPIDVRFVAASKVSLKDLMNQGRFRADLFYRLNVVPITIPPLRDRREDIPVIVDHFIKMLAPDLNITVAREAMKALVDYNWPGNVRELKNIVDRLVIFAHDEITLDDLPLEIKGGDPVELLMHSCLRCFESGSMDFHQVMECLEMNLL
ncbi:MAG TPA: sigma-54 dependent transcriptional regulator, partial [Acidobacteriota bacterium]|nr:sigma-54 dependent transcriptional regulator [Acidobacteriota bacterium]